MGRGRGAMRATGITFVRIGEFAWSRLEPQAGRFEFDWLDRALAVLGGAGLRVVLCTPTATPPKWLVDKYPGILPVGRDGRTRGFGSRRHSSFSSSDWWEQSGRIVTVLAERYGEHPAGGRLADRQRRSAATTPCCRTGRRIWRRSGPGCASGTGTRARSTGAWGNVFWSMEAGDFEAVELPSGTVTEANPAARLDFQRFGSDQVVRYGDMQAAILRAHSPGRFVTHNFMGAVLRLRSLGRGSGARFRDLGCVSARIYAAVSLRASGTAGVQRDGAAGHRGVSPRSLQGDRQGPVLGDGAAVRAGELGAVEPGAQAGGAAAVDVGGAGARGGGGELFPLAAGAVRAGADAFGTDDAGPAALAGRRRGGAGRTGARGDRDAAGEWGRRRWRWCWTIRPPG